MNIHSDILERLEKFIETRSIPNIIFHGISGSGKRTLLNKFIKMIYNDNKDAIKNYVLYVNCAQGKGIKFIREDLKLFAKTHINTHGGVFFKSIILLNADKLTIDAQSALRRCIEVFSHTTRFFIVVEDKYKLLKPILSRFCEIYVQEVAVNGVIINLNKYMVEQTDGYSEREMEKKTILKRMINKIQKELTLENIRDSAKNIFHKGFNSLDVITYFEEQNSFKIDSFKKQNILFHFHQTRREYRNEMLSIFFILYSFFLCSESNLENMIHM